VNERLSKLLILGMFVALTLCMIRIHLLTEKVNRLEGRVENLENIDSLTFFKQIGDMFKIQEDINDKLTKEVVLLNLSMRELEREDTTPTMKKRRNENASYQQSNL